MRTRVGVNLDIYELLIINTLIMNGLKVVVKVQSMQAQNGADKNVRNEGNRQSLTPKLPH